MLCQQPDQQAGMPSGAEPWSGDWGGPLTPLQLPRGGQEPFAHHRQDPGALHIACPLLTRGVHFRGQTGNVGLCPEPFGDRAAELSPASREGGRHLPPAMSAGCR